MENDGFLFILIVSQFLVGYLPVDVKVYVPSERVLSIPCWILAGVLVWLT